MIALDTNILVYAQREDSPHRAAAGAVIEGLANGAAAWALPWPVVHEFVAVVTNPRLFEEPTPVETAFGWIEDLLGDGGARAIGEGVDHIDHLDRLRRLMVLSGRVGGHVHDARIAAICLAHGVRELWTADRDFSYFADLKTRNPLAG